MAIVWETRQERLDFHTVQAKWRGREMPIGRIRFLYFWIGGRDFWIGGRDTKQKARTQAWEVASVPILQRINELGA